MPTTFNVLYLGNQPDLDPTEGNTVAENASALVGETLGSAKAPLYDEVRSFSQLHNYFQDYWTDNTLAADKFTIDGGSTKTFDTMVTYKATLNFADGTAADITAIVVQATDGETYLVPEQTDNADHAAMQSGPIESISINSVVSAGGNLIADRMEWEPEVPDGDFEGTGGDDLIEVGDTDDEGDPVTDGADVINGGMGDDTIKGGGGDDTIYGGTGDDEIYGEDGNDELHGGRGDDFISGGDGNDTIYAGAGNDTVEGGAGDDLIIGDGGSSSGGSSGGSIQLEWTALHMGKAASIDPTGTGNWAEDADSIIGTWGGVDNPLDSNQVRVSVVDSDGDGRVDSDGDSVPETMVIDGTNFTLDAAVVYNAEVTFEDGTTGTISAVVFQTTDGNLFLAPEMSHNADAKLMESQPIQSIKLISVATNNTALSADRWDHGYVDSAEHGDDYIDAGDGDDTVIGGGGNDTIIGGAGNDSLDGGDGNDLLIGGDGDDVFVVSGGNDTIADFNSGNSGALGDGDTTNNDFVDLSGHYDNKSELQADLADDGILNQSNTVDTHGRTVDYSDNTQFGSGSLTFKGDVKLTTDNTGVVCFTPGTAILTPAGERAVEDLRAGELVCTLDNGPQPIVWIGSTTLSAAELAANPKLMPVLVSAQFLGTERSLLVSPQHGLILPGTDDTLVRAKHLRRFLPGSRVARGKRGVTYVHMIFESHQIVFSNGYPTESLYPGPQAMKAMSTEARAEVEMLFPGVLGCETRLRTCSVYGGTARQFRAA